MPDNKEVTELIGHIRGAGFRVSKSGNQKHWKVMTRMGAAVLDANGPLIISTTPGETRFREMTVKRLMAANVLKVDPYKKTATGPAEKKEPKKRGNLRVGSPELEALKVAGIRARSERFREQTAQLRGRLEPIISKLGGWKRAPHATSGVGAKEFGQVVMHWAKVRGRIELPKDATEDTTRQAALRLSKPGETLAEKWYDLFAIFIEELERDDDPPGRYRELLREQKGIAPAPSGPPAMEPPVDRPARQDHLRSAETVFHMPAPPALALRVAFWLGSSEVTEEDATAIVTEIAEMEMKQ